MKTVYCKLAKNQHVLETRSVALEDFALGLASGQAHAVNASQAEWHIEGPYWLVKVSSIAWRWILTLPASSQLLILAHMPVLWLQQTLGKAYQTTEDQVIYLASRYPRATGS